MNSFLDGFLHESHYPADQIKQLKINTSVLSIRKGHLLQSAGDTTHKAYFVKKGLLRSYTIDEKEKEHIFMFAPEDWLLADMNPQVSPVPTKLYIDAIEDSEIEVFDASWITQADGLPSAFLAHEMNRLIKRIGVLQKRVILLMSASATERYEDFMETYPHIAQRVPLKMIASYLGITPEALSKVRSGLTKIKIDYVK